MASVTLIHIYEFHLTHFVDQIKINCLKNKIKQKFLISAWLHYKVVLSWFIIRCDSNNNIAGSIN